jgi:hypothetical protein
MCHSKNVTVGLGKVRDFIQTQTAPASPERAAMIKLVVFMFDRPGVAYDATRFENAVYHDEIQAGVQKLLTSGAV